MLTIRIMADLAATKDVAKETGALCHCSNATRSYFGHAANVKSPIRLRTFKALDGPGRDRLVLMLFKNSFVFARRVFEREVMGLCGGVRLSKRAH